MEVRYSANGYDYKIVEETDGWWSIYRFHEFKGSFVPMIQAKTLEKAKNWCMMCEALTVKAEKL
ncbi:hypothetical protein [Clostridium sp.]|uniref:hypothetical protein n=1 Tax=Clostridium sp. TaxID=1506 RepID=UPI001B4F0AD1|nr:hypothetical protein [Clostridium sp.]MBP3916616.1 hypothetical protein [Clostridium sp.]